MIMVALIYIYSQSASPGTWKFNKARQNWIIRNVWTSKVRSEGPEGLHLSDSLSAPSGPGKVRPDGCRLFVQGSGAG